MPSGSPQPPGRRRQRDDDRLLDLGQTAALVAALRGARWLRYPDTGHGGLRDQPDRLAADLTGFLATVAPSGP